MRKKLTEAQAKSLARLRKEARLTQREAAALAGVDRVTVARWETAVATPGELALAHYKTLLERHSK